MGQGIAVGGWVVVVSGWVGGWVGGCTWGGAGRAPCSLLCVFVLWGATTPSSARSLPYPAAYEGVRPEHLTVRCLRKRDYMSDGVLGAAISWFNALCVGGGRRGRALLQASRFLNHD